MTKIGNKQTGQQQQQLTSSVNNSGLLDGLLQDTERIVHGTLGLVQNLLRGSTKDYGARFTKSYARESQELQKTWRTAERRRVSGSKALKECGNETARRGGKR